MAYRSWQAPKDEIKLLREKISLDFTGGYLFWGEEEYLKRYYSEQLCDKIRGEGMADFNLTEVEFEKGATVDDLLSALDTPPVFAAHKLVKVTGLPIEGLKKDEEKKLLGAVEALDEDTVLILYFYNEELDLAPKKTREKKIFTTLAESLEFVQFKRQSHEKLLSWVDKIFTSESLHISDVAIGRMITLCDYSMSRLRQESDKLVCRAKFEERTQVPAEWVDELVMPSAEAALGQLADAVTEMSCREAASIFENLAGQNYDVSEIFGTISRALTTLQVFHSALSDGRSPKDACTASGAFPWLADKMASTARSRTASGLRRSVEACYECDTSLKLDSKNKLFTLQRLIFLLTSEAYR